MTMKYISLKAFDGTIVRVKDTKAKEFIDTQEKIKQLLKEGKDLKEIKEILKKDNK